LSWQALARPAGAMAKRRGKGSVGADRGRRSGQSSDGGGVEPEPRRRGRSAGLPVEQTMSIARTTRRTAAKKPPTSSSSAAAAAAAAADNSQHHGDISYLNILHSLQFK